MAQSIIQTERECFICGRTEPLHKHHMLEGSYREKAEEYGLTCYLCAEHHMKAHENEHLIAFLRQIAQRKAMEHYNWDEWEFIKHIGRSFL